jgi:hypothetical protein
VGNFCRAGRQRPVILSVVKEGFWTVPEVGWQKIGSSAPATKFPLIILRFIYAKLSIDFTVLK